MKISVVINTYNEEANIEQAIKSVDWADEVIVCDMHSTDKTVQIARKEGVKIFYHKLTDYVEPARNFAISKASNDWVLILDADEVIPQSLAQHIQKMIEKPIVSDYVEIPRKNIIFGKWMKASMWWPDYNIRLFKKGKVLWSDKIHSKPTTKGEGIILSEDEEMAIIHNNYQSISQFISRMNRYTQIEANILTKEGYKFNWIDLIRKPLSEFLSRFFANKGYLDGIHGFALSFMQAFSFFVVYAKVWENEGFLQKDLEMKELEEEKNKIGFEFNYWFLKSKKGGNFFNKFFNKIKTGK